MPETVDALILDLLAWIATGPRPYAEVMEAWRTSCPKLPVWEEANARGFISRRRAPGAGPLVVLTTAGAHHLSLHREPARA
jgi:D-3-phosphoglycerate dehydrogenase